MGDFCLRGLGGLGLLELALQCGDLLLQGDELWLGSSGSNKRAGLELRRVAKGAVKPQGQLAGQLDGFKPLAVANAVVDLVRRSLPRWRSACRIWRTCGSSPRRWSTARSSSAWVLWPTVRPMRSATSCVRLSASRRSLRTQLAGS